MSSVDRDSGGKEMPNLPGKEKERRNPIWPLLILWVQRPILLIDLYMNNSQKNNRRQLFLFQPAKILEEKEGGVQFPNPQIGPDSLCVHQATLPNQRPHISNGSQSRRSKIASAAPSVGKSFSNLELQRTNRIEWAWPLETNLSHFCILHKKWFSQSTRLC